MASVGFEAERLGTCAELVRKQLEALREEEEEAGEVEVEEKLQACELALQHLQEVTVDVYHNVKATTFATLNIDVIEGRPTPLPVLHTALRRIIKHHRELSPAYKTLFSHDAARYISVIDQQLRIFANNFEDVIQSIPTTPKRTRQA